VPKHQWIRFRCLRPIDKDVLDNLAYRKQCPSKSLCCFLPYVLHVSHIFHKQILLFAKASQLAFG
jgi:hypothetical protein